MRVVLQSRPAPHWKVQQRILPEENNQYHHLKQARYEPLTQAILFIKTTARPRVSTRYQVATTTPDSASCSRADMRCWSETATKHTAPQNTKHVTTTTKINTNTISSTAVTAMPAGPFTCSLLMHSMRQWSMSLPTRRGVRESCPPGTISTNSGASSCEPCGCGTQPNLNHTTVCSPTLRTDAFSTRPSSEISVVKGACACDSCGAGTEANATQSGCQLCLPGTYSPDDGPCRPCPNGLVSSAAGAVTCTPCNADSEVDSTHTRCVLCPIGIFSPNGLACQPCPSAGPFARVSPKVRAAPSPMAWDHV